MKYEKGDKFIIEIKRQKGEWVEKYAENDSDLTRHRFYCSACGGWQTYGRTDYCPNCGADMRGEKDE